MKPEGATPASDNGELVTSTMKSGVALVSDGPSESTPPLKDGQRWPPALRDLQRSDAPEAYQGQEWCLKCYLDVFRDAYSKSFIVDTIH